MNEYHVGCGVVGIYAGKLNEDGDTWIHKTDVTKEAIAAVTEHFMRKDNLQPGQWSGVSYNRADGAVVHLSVSVDRPDEYETLDACSMWISCKERLPEPLTDVIATYRYGDGLSKRAAAQAYMEKPDSQYDWCYADGEPLELDVTHWMPMPSTEGLT